MVVSEIGETWSPNTAPPSVAETVRRASVPLPPKIVTAIGTSTPNVPHEVPVEKAIKPARIKKIAGNKNFGKSFNANASVLKNADNKSIDVVK